MNTLLQHIEWLDKRVKLAPGEKDYVIFAMQEYARKHYENKVKNLDKNSNETHGQCTIDSISRRYLELVRQWFDAVQDLNPAYLQKDDYYLAKEIYKLLGYRIPNSIIDNCG